MDANNLFFIRLFVNLDNIIYLDKFENGRVQKWTNLPIVSDPKIQFHPVTPQASAVHSRAAPFQA